MGRAQVVFEEFGFGSFLAAPAQPLALRAWAAQRPDLAANPAGVGLVVDAGFSFTHAAPTCDGRVLRAGVSRINVGGKALTNYLKELVSYRRVATLLRPSVACPGCMAILLLLSSPYIFWSLTVVL